MTKAEQALVRRMVKRGYLAMGPDGSIGFHTDIDEYLDGSGCFVTIDKSFTRLMADFRATFCDPQATDAEANARELAGILRAAAIRLDRLANSIARRGR